MPYARTLMAGAALAVVFPAMLSGCGQPIEKKSNEPVAANTAATESDKNAQLLAAAEDYETLTESAFDKPLGDLAAVQAAAHEKVRGIGRWLTADQSRRLDELNMQLDAAQKAQDRSMLALAAVESFRVLVSAQDATGKTPVEVSLLDYAGFKYDALNKARPVDWDQMAADAKFARDTWTRLSPQVRAAALNGAFDNAVTGMEKAVEQKNQAAAAIAASNELALVDLVEEYFSSAK